MYQSLWQALAPFHRHYKAYVLGVVLRQGLLVAGGYLLVWALSYCLKHTGVPEWIFVLAFVAYDAGVLRADIDLNTMFVSRLSYPLFGHLRSSALRKVLDLPLQWHNQQDSGALVGRVNNGVGKVCQVTEAVARELAPALIRTALSLIPLLWFSPWTAPAILLGLSIFLGLTFAENRRREPLRERRFENYSNDFGMFAESVQYVKPVVQFGQTERVLERYGDLQKSIQQDGLAEHHLGNGFAWRRNLVISLVKRGCQGVWIWQYRAGTLDIAMVMYLNMLTEELLNSFWNYASLLDRLFEGMEPVRVLLQLLEEDPGIADAPSAEPVAIPAQVGVEMVNVHFAYGRRRSVMSDLCLRIEPGTVVGIVGPSGSGKTTIHNLLSRMFDIPQGKILVEGVDIRHWPLRQLRSLFSYVTQNDGVFLSNTNLMDTIRFARPGASDGEVLAVARAACIHDDILRMPDQYRTIAGQRGVTLSKGQQQRIALAQALIALDRHRKVLVLDEFTSALDSRTEQQILKNLQPWFEGRTVIIIAHRLSTVARIAGRIVVIENGSVVESGSHEELVARGGWYSQMARMQAVA